MVSVSTSNKAVTESLAIEIRVKVLFATFKELTKKSWSSFESDARFNMVGYYTLRNLVLRDSVTGMGDNFVDMVQRGMNVIDRMDDVPAEVEGMIKKCGVVSGVDLTHKVCEALCQAGIVAELILVPVETLREVQVNCVREQELEEVEPRLELEY